MHRRSLLAISVGVILAGCFGTPRAAEQQATSPEMRAKMIQLIDALEKNPYEKEAKSARRAVLEWLTEAPDVTVTICPALLVDIHKLKGDDGSLLFGQLPFSEAKFILEHPDQAEDAQAVHLAGVEGVIRTYQAMKARKPKLKFEPMEELMVLQTEGKLSDFVASAIAQCE